MQRCLDLETVNPTRRPTLVVIWLVRFISFSLLERISRDAQKRPPPRSHPRQVTCQLFLHARITSTSSVY